MRSIYKLLTSKVFYKWMISYVIVLSIPTIIIGYFFYSRTSLLMDEKNVEDYRQRVENFSVAADGKLKDINRIGVMLSESSWVKKVMDYNENKNDEFDPLLLMQIKKELLNYRTLNPVIEYISVVFPYGDCVLTNDGIDDIDFFINHTNAFSAQEAGNILDGIKEYNYFKILNYSTVNIFGKSDEVVPIIQSLNYSSTMTPRATMIALVNKNVLMEMAEKEIQGKSGITCMVIFPDGAVIDNVGGVSGSILPEECFDEEVKNGVYKTETDHVFVKASRYAPWKYAFMVSEALMVSRPRNLVVFIPAITLGAFLAGFLAATLFSAMNLKPLRKLAEQAGLIAGESPRISRINEYNAIRQSIQLVEEQKQVKDQQILKYWPLIMENKLEERKRNEDPDDAAELKAILNPIGVEIEDKNRYSVILFEIAGGPAAGGSEGEVMSGRVLEFIEDTVREKDIKVFPLQDRKRTMVLLCPQKPDDVGKVNIGKLVTSIRSRFAGDPEVWVSMGPFLEGMDGISLSYQKAKTELDNIIFTGGKWYEKNREGRAEDAGEFYYYPIELEAQIINHLKNGDVDSVEDIIKKLKDENYNQRRLSSESLRRLLVKMIETVMQAADSLNYGDAAWKEEYGNIMKSKTDVEMWNFIQEAVHKICGYVSSIHENLRYKMNEHIIKYVNSEYTSKTISLKEMSARFRIPAPTLSKMFKELSGINFLDYVNRKRIEKAKELLTETGLEIYAISEALGYESVKTFRRMFKKYAGVNPTVFRAQISGIGIGDGEMGQYSAENI